MKSQCLPPSIQADGTTAGRRQAILINAPFSSAGDQVNFNSRAPDILPERTKALPETPSSPTMDLLKLSMQDHANPPARQGLRFRLT